MNTELMHRIEMLEAAISNLTVHLIAHHQISCHRNLHASKRKSKCL